MRLSYNVALNSYRKTFKAKDVSQYSPSDIAAIFGTKPAEDKSGADSSSVMIGAAVEADSNNGDDNATCDRVVDSQQKRRRRGKKRGSSSHVDDLSADSAPRENAVLDAVDAECVSVDKPPLHVLDG